MAIAVQMDYRVDLCKPVHLIQMDVPFFMGDKNAHRFHVTLERNGCTIDVGNISATGYMVRADKQTVIWDARVEGCDIYLTMPASCYAVAGRFRLLLRVTSGDTVETALWVEGSIRESTTDIIVDPDNVLPNLEELLAQIEEMETATAEAREITDKAAEFLSASPPAIVVDVSGDVVTIADGAERAAQSVVSMIEAVQSGTGDPTPDNIRAISGWDAVTLCLSNVNMLPKPKSGTYDTKLGVVITVSDDGTMRIAGTTTAAVNVSIPLTQELNKYTGMYVYIFNTTICSELVLLARDSQNTNVFQVPVTKLGRTDLITASDDRPITAIGIYIAAGTTLDVTVKPMIAASDTATYVPYQGQTFTADLPETICGGTLDWVTGLLTVTCESYTLDGITNKFGHVGEADGNIFAHHVLQNRSILHTGLLLTSHLKSNAVAKYGCAYIAGQNADNLFSYIQAFASVDEANAWLIEQAAAGTPYQICYELATPYTIQLTAQQLDMLKGNNALWSDCGDTSVTYIADTKLYIDNKLAELTAAMLSTGANV